MKLYDIIYADPPWRYEKGTTTKNREIENHYPTMSLEEIKDIKIPSKENCLLYLWATAPLLDKALDVLKAWNFKYKTCAIWNKMRMGMGYWFRINHELLLVGVKGKFSPPKPNERTESVFNIKRSNKHSRKPNYIRTLISKWYPDKEKIELFARVKFKSWDVWGNEVNQELPNWIKRFE